MTNYDKDRRKKILITILIIIFIGLVYFLLINENTKVSFNNRGGEEIEEPQTGEEKFNDDKESVKPVYTFDEELENDREWNENDFAQQASSFAERFGSYSSQSDYGNLTDLKYYMSERMSNWATDYIRDLKNNSSSVDEHYDIKTNVFLAPEVRNYSPQATSVEVLVSTDRLETNGPNTNSFKQDILIKYVKENGQWLVDSANWQ